MLDPELIEFFNDFKKEIKDDMNSMKNDMNSMKDDMNSMKNDMNSMKNDMNSMKDDMNSMKTNINSMNERLTSLENICTVIQEEHGYKLDLLLDYASANIEKHEEYDKKFNKIDNKLFIHDTKLAIIEGSDIYKNMIKGKGKSNLKNTIL